MGPTKGLQLFPISAKVSKVAIWDDTSPKRDSTYVSLLKPFFLLCRYLEPSGQAACKSTTA